MSEMIAPFVDIGGIGDNHYLIKAYISKLLRTTTFCNISPLLRVLDPVIVLFCI
jgi:hypothetical protein